MNDGQYTNLRNYLEEIASTSKQLLEGQQRTNELLHALGTITDRADKRAKAAVEAPLPEGTVWRDDFTEMRTVTREADIHLDDGAKVTHQKSADATVVEDKPKTATKVDAKSKAKPDKSDLPWPTYDTDSEEAIIARLRNMPLGDRNKALAYERKNKNRVNIARVNWNSFA